MGNSAVLQCPFGALDASVSYLEVFSHQQRPTTAKRLSTGSEKLPRKNFKEDYAWESFYSVYSLSALASPEVSQDTLVEVEGDLEWLYPDLLCSCIWFLFPWKLSQLKLEMLLLPFEWWFAGRKLLEKGESKVHSSCIEEC